MQIVIDIADSAYKVCYDLRNVGDTNCLADILVNAVGVGTPIPDNATNGDVIKALFKPNQIRRVDDVVTEEYEFDADWWNSPYQKGGK